MAKELLNRGKERLRFVAEAVNNSSTVSLFTTAVIEAAQSETTPALVCGGLGVVSGVKDIIVHKHRKARELHTFLRKEELARGVDDLVANAKTDYAVNPESGPFISYKRPVDREQVQEMRDATLQLLDQYPGAARFSDDTFKTIYCEPEIEGGDAVDQISRARILLTDLKYADTRAVILQYFGREEDADGGLWKVTKEIDWQVEKRRSREKLTVSAVEKKERIGGEAAQSVQTMALSVAEVQALQQDIVNNLPVLH